MAYSNLRYFKRCAEFLTRDEIRNIPINTRGIYSLMIKKPNNKFETVYIGMAAGKKAGVRGRIAKHAKSKRKNLNPKTRWTHFSVFETWPNISIEEIKEIEGILRHVYRKSNISNPLNQQRRFIKLIKVKNNNLVSW